MQESVVQVNWGISLVLGVVGCSLQYVFWVGVRGRQRAFFSLEFNSPGGGRRYPSRATTRPR
jgi:hypothetical protein